MNDLDLNLMSSPKWILIGTHIIETNLDFLLFGLFTFFVGILLASKASLVPILVITSVLYIICIITIVYDYSNKHINNIFTEKYNLKSKRIK